MSFQFSSREPISFPQEKRQQLLLIIFVVSVLVVLLVLYFGFLRSGPTSEIPPEGKKAASKDVSEQINFDANFFKSPNFKDLKLYGEWSLEAERKGRNHPFLPY